MRFIALYHCAIQLDLVFVPLVLVPQVPEPAHVYVSFWTGYSVNNFFEQAVTVIIKTKSVIFLLSFVKTPNVYLLLSSLRDQVWVLNDLVGDIHIDKLFFLLDVMKVSI